MLLLFFFILSCAQVTQFWLFLCGSKLYNYDLIIPKWHLSSVFVFLCSCHSNINFRLLIFQCQTHTPWSQVTTRLAWALSFVKAFKKVLSVVLAKKELWKRHLCRFAESRMILMGGWRVTSKIGLVDSRQASGIFFSCLENYGLCNKFSSIIRFWVNIKCGI